MSKSKKLFYFGVIPALFIQLVGSFFYFYLYAGTTFASVLYIATKIAIIVFPALCLYFLFRGVLKSNNREKWYQSLEHGVLWGLLMAAPVVVLYLIFGDYFRQFAGGLRFQAESLKILDHYILFSVFLSIVHAFIEEYYWRWFVFRGLEIKFSPVWAAVIGSAAFASHHFIILMEFFPFWISSLFVVAVGIGGLIWCWLYYKTDSILVPWISHAVVDAAVMTVGYLLLF